MRTGSQSRPQLGVSVLVRKDGRVLLVRRARPPLAGQWSLPGGKVEFGERLEDAAIREIREETGITVNKLARIDMAQIIGRNPAGRVAHHFVLVVFSAAYRSGRLRAADDAAEARWVGLRDYGSLAITEDTRRVLAVHGAA